jgi:mono/diheme cytochrome c family protein
LLLLTVVFSLMLGFGLARAVEPPGTVDVIPATQKLGQELYLENCATCHIGIPPAVMPTQTWRDLLQDPQHYGAELSPIAPLNLRLIWNYILFSSRSLKPDEKIPFRLRQSQIFKALHPRVDLPREVGLTSCVSCHPGASQYNFRRLTPNWDNAP